MNEHDRQTAIHRADYDQYRARLREWIIRQDCELIANVANIFAERINDESAREDDRMMATAAWCGIMAVLLGEP